MTKLLEFVQLVFHQSQIHNVLSTPLILLLPVTGLKKFKAKLPPKLTKKKAFKKGFLTGFEIHEKRTICDTFGVLRLSAKLASTWNNFL